MQNRERKIQLVQVVVSYDGIGQVKETEKLVNVFAKLRSVSMNEWTQAGQLGLSASYQAEIWSHEYSGEEYVIINGKKYHVYRTYETGDRIELYLEEMVGHGGDG